MVTDPLLDTLYSQIVTVDWARFQALSDEELRVKIEDTQKSLNQNSLRPFSPSAIYLSSVLSALLILANNRRLRVEFASFAITG